MSRKLTRISPDLWVDPDEIRAVRIDDNHKRGKTVTLVLESSSHAVDLLDTIPAAGMERPPAQQQRVVEKWLRDRLGDRLASLGQDLG